MPELHAFPSYQLPTLPEPPSQEAFRDFKRMPLDCCRDIIHATAVEVDEIEDAVPIFKVSRDKNPQVDLLKFVLDKVLIYPDGDKTKVAERTDELHVYEDVLYVTAVKIFNLYNDLRIRFANGFIQPDTLVVTGFTAANMLDLLWQRWGAIFDLEVLATLNFAVRKENLMAFKTEHNAAVFLRNKPFKHRYAKRNINASIRRALNRYAFNEAELVPMIQGLQKLTEFNPAAFSAHVQQKNSAALTAWDTVDDTVDDTLDHFSNASPSPCPSPDPHRSRHDSMDLDVKPARTSTTLKPPHTNTYDMPSFTSIRSTNSRKVIGGYGFSETNNFTPEQSFDFGDPDRFLDNISTEAPSNSVCANITPTDWLNPGMRVDEYSEDDTTQENEGAYVMDVDSNQDSNDSHMDFVLQPTTYSATPNTQTRVEPTPAEDKQKLNVINKLRELAGPVGELIGKPGTNAAIRKKQFIQQTELDIARANAERPSLATTPTQPARPRMQLLAPTIFGQRTSKADIHNGLTYGSPTTPMIPAAKPLRRSLNNDMTAPSATAAQHVHDQQHNAGRLERHRGRALLKLEGKLVPDVDMKAWNYGTTCGCDNACDCAYWCRKEPWHMCACQRPVARVRVNGPLEDDAISIASTIEDELWHSWEMGCGKKRWW
ncbi:hypothetical protein IWZ01DRAFT_541022 [Phyllosticta capitalensis]